MGGAGGAGGAALAPSCRRDFFGCGAAPGLPLSGSRFGGLLVGAASVGIHAVVAKGGEVAAARVQATWSDADELIREPLLAAGCYGMAPIPRRAGSTSLPYY